MLLTHTADRPLSHPTCPQIDIPVSRAANWTTPSCPVFSDEEDGTLGEDYRVMKANFSGATCPLCGQPIVQGDIISRLIASQGPAHEGWSHTACLIAKLKQEQAAS